MKISELDPLQSGFTPTLDILPIVHAGRTRSMRVSDFVQTISGIDGTNFMPTAGGTFGGPVYLYADPTAPTEAATRRYVDNKVGSATTGIFLLLTGGVLTGPLAMGVAVPANSWPRTIQTEMLSVPISPGGVGFNTYVDSGATMKALANGTAAALVANGVAPAFNLYTASAVTKDAAITWVGRLIYDGRGNLGLNMVPPPTQALGNTTNGGWMFGWGVTTGNVAANGYYDGTNWRYLADGGVAVSSSGGSGFNWVTAPTGAKDAVATVTTRMTLDPSGNLTATGLFSAARVEAKLPTGGYIRLEGAGATNSGYVALYNGANTRMGYMGNNDGTWFFINAENAANGILITAPQVYMTGTASVASGIAYRNYSTNVIGFGWDGTNVLINAYVDGTYQFGLASRTWTSNNFYTAGTADGRYLYKGGDTCSGSLAVNGNVTVNSFIKSYYALVAQGNDGIGRFITSHQSGHSACGFFNYNNVMYFGNSDGNGGFVDPWVTRATLNPGGDFNANGQVVAANGCFARGGNSGIFAGGSGVVIQHSPSWYWDWNISNGNLAWVTPYGTTMTLDSSRNVILEQGLFINGSAIVCQVNCIGINYQSGAYATSASFLFGWNNVVGGLATVSINNGGAAYAMANASDARLKHNIGSSDFDCLDAISKLSLVSFDWLQVDDPWRLKQARAMSRTSVVSRHKVRVGLIAQEVMKVLPEAVHEGDDFEDRLGRVWGLDNNVMEAVVVGAIQQLIARNAALAARIEILEQQRMH
jgi:hypothetical protein